MTELDEKHALAIRSLKEHDAAVTNLDKTVVMYSQQLDSLKSIRGSSNPDVLRVSIQTKAAELEAARNQLAAAHEKRPALAAAVRDADNERQRVSVADKHRFALHSLEVPVSAVYSGYRKSSLDIALTAAESLMLGRVFNGLKLAGKTFPDGRALHSQEQVLSWLLYTVGGE